MQPLEYGFMVCDWVTDSNKNKNQSKEETVSIHKLSLRQSARPDDTTHTPPHFREIDSQPRLYINCCEGTN